jgi:hypothetical protein
MTPEEQKRLDEAAAKALHTLKEEAKLRAQMASSIEGYVGAIKAYKKIQETINRNLAIEKKLEAEITKAKRANSGVSQQDLDIAERKLQILKEQTLELEKEKGILKDNLAEVNKTKLAFGELSGKAVKGLAIGLIKLPKIVKGLHDSIKSSGLYEMDKAIKESALSMGLVGSRGAEFTKSIRNASDTTNELGMGVKELAKMQTIYSDELGRSVMLGESGMKAMAEIAAATGLGAEGAAKMSAEMELQGVSAERTRDFMEQTMNDASSMGLNASKVIKNTQNGMKLLNRYNFKDGVKGLTNMAKLVTKLGVGMDFASGFADKLWDVEGAVDMAAQLQVMGGAWANMADPFHLMYMARNDIAGLTEELANAAAASATFNAKNGEMEIGAMEMHRLKKIAEQTGVSYDELVTSAKNAAKFTKIKSQVSFAMDDEAKEFLANTAKMDKNGRAYIEVGGETKFLNELGASGRDIIAKQVAEKKGLAERAKSAQSFDEKITNLINMVKTNMLPIIDGITEELTPLVKDVFSNKEGFITELKALGKDIGEIVKVGASVIKTVGDMAVQLGPKGILATVLTVKGLGFLWDKASWLMNGITLGMGFNSVANAGGSGGNSITDFLGKNGKTGRLRSASKIGKFAKGVGGASAGLLSAGISGYDEWSGNKAAGMDENENAKRTGVRAAAAGGGAWGGAALGATIGTMIFPGVGTAIGGLIGGIAGGMAGDKIGDSGGDAIWGKTNKGELSIGDETNDGVFPRLGSDFSKNRAIIQGGKIHPIDNKDDLMAMKPNGVVDKEMKSNNSSGVVKHVFEPISINGTILITSPGNPGQAIDLLKDSQFKRDITRVIQSEVEKNKNGGKNRG